MRSFLLLLVMVLLSQSVLANDIKKVNCDRWVDGDLQYSETHEIAPSYFFDQLTFEFGGHQNAYPSNRVPELGDVTFNSVTMNIALDSRFLAEIKISKIVEVLGPDDQPDEYEQLVKRAAGPLTLEGSLTTEATINGLIYKVTCCILDPQSTQTQCPQ